MKLILSALIVISVALGINATTYAKIKVENDWLLDIPSCPVRLSLRERKDYFVFFNESESEVSEIRLGVVKFEKQRYYTVSANSSVELNGKLQSGEAQLSGTSLYLKDIDSAVEKKAKLAIISIKYSDGSTWNVSSDCDSNKTD